MCGSYLYLLLQISDLVWGNRLMHYLINMFMIPHKHVYEVLVVPMNMVTYTCQTKWLIHLFTVHMSDHNPLAQLSKKAEHPLAKFLATASCRSSNTGPWTFHVILEPLSVLWWLPSGTYRLVFNLTPLWKCNKYILLPWYIYIYIYVWTPFFELILESAPPLCLMNFSTEYN